MSSISLLALYSRSPFTLMAQHLLPLGNGQPPLASFLSLIY
ncbi:Uncharacterised protein [Vibrio cholerae]|nr:Uncharacterised protein [Vibrio cholerae]